MLMDCTWTDPRGDRGWVGRVDPSMQLSVPAEILVRDLSAESVLLNLRTERYFGLDEVGTRMWKALTAGDSVGSALEKLREVYEIAPYTLERDLLGLAEELLQHGLLEIHRRS